MKKLIDLGVRGRLLRWTADFISERMGRVRYNDARSGYREYRYGLPQGSCLSPILFNVFFRDVFKAEINDRNVKVAVYADDISVTVEAASAREAAKQLSLLLGAVEQWGYRNRVRFDKASDKCGFMIFSRRITESPVVTFGKERLKQLTSHKHLGVTFNGRLNFSEHIAHVKAKAWSAYHAVRRVVGHNWGVTTGTVMRLYIGLVRPILESACVVWDGASSADKVKLDRVH